MDARGMSAADAGAGSRAIAGQHAPLYFWSADATQEPMPAEKVSRKAVSPVTAGSSKGWTSAACAAVATAAIATPVASSFMLMSRACVGASQSVPSVAEAQFSRSHDEKPPNLCRRGRDASLDQSGARTDARDARCKNATSASKRPWVQPRQPPNVNVTGETAAEPAHFAMAFAASIPTSTVATRGAASHARRARVAGCRRRAAGWRERKVVIARAFGTSRDRDSGGEDAELVSRRTLLAGKALFTVGEAFVFPWATEGATRPPAPGDDLLVPFSPAWLRSILYSETDPDVKAAAKAALLEGEALAAEGKHAAAIERFEAVYATAPREYKMCQRAGLDISLSYKAMSQRLGDEFDKKANDAKGVVWWWGRGTRWPGWYIIAYLSARNVYFTAKDDPVGAFTVKEGLFVLVPIWLGLLFTLVQYGLPDY